MTNTTRGLILFKSLNKSGLEKVDKVFKTGNNPSRSHWLKLENFKGKIVNINGLLTSGFSITLNFLEKKISE